MDDRMTAAQPGPLRIAALAIAAGLSLAAAGPGAASTAQPQGWARPAVGPIDFRGQPASADARAAADWVRQSGDNRGRPFIIIDKVTTQVFVFDGRTNLRGVTIALLGLARGDDVPPDIGARRLSQIRPEERATQAGRFVASLGPNASGQDVLWIDPKTALALHRVLTSDPRQQRLERLRPDTRLSRRVTFGCINVPVDFYERVVRPQFLGTTGVVYILPETPQGRADFYRRIASR